MPCSTCDCSAFAGSDQAGFCAGCGHARGEHNLLTCSICGTPAEKDATFCGSCGARLAGNAKQAERSHSVPTTGGLSPLRPAATPSVVPVAATAAASDGDASSSGASHQVVAAPPSAAAVSRLRYPLRRSERLVLRGLAVALALIFASLLGPWWKWSRGYLSGSDTKGGLLVVLLGAALVVTIRFATPVRSVWLYPFLALAGVIAVAESGFRARAGSGISPTPFMDSAVAGSLLLTISGIAGFVVALRSDHRIRENIGHQTEPEKACPQCAESVKAAAAICRFCGHRFIEPRPMVPSP